jgi:hypothetical protein
MYYHSTLWGSSIIKLFTKIPKFLKNSFLKIENLSKLKWREFFKKVMEILPKFLKNSFSFCQSGILKNKIIIWHLSARCK